MARNPRAKVHKVLGITAADFAARRTELEAYLDLNDNKEEIPEADMRAALTVPVIDRVWNELKRIVGVS